MKIPKEKLQSLLKHLQKAENIAAEFELTTLNGGFVDSWLASFRSELEQKYETVSEPQPKQKKEIGSSPQLTKAFNYLLKEHKEKG